MANLSKIFVLRNYHQVYILGVILRVCWKGAHRYIILFERKFRGVVDTQVDTMIYKTTNVR